jgi:hypothetical protein
MLIVLLLLAAVTILRVSARSTPRADDAPVRSELAGDR